MRFSVFATTVALLALLVAAPITATAAPNGTNGTGTTVSAGNVTVNVSVGSTTASSSSTPSGPQPTANGTTERIDGNTVILASSYDDSAGVARITLRSETIQVVTLSDAGAFAQGGTIPVRSVAMEAGETTTVEIPVTERNGMVGVAISTENTPLYAEIVKEQSGGLSIMKAMGTLQAWGAGALVAFVWTALAGYSEMQREDGRPEVAR